MSGGLHSKLSNSGLSVLSCQLNPFSFEEHPKMSQVVWDEMIDSPGTMTPNSTTGAPLPFEQPPKLKGRRRLLQRLQRMSSSPSLAKLGRTPSSTYVNGGKASMSCVSLTSSSSRHGPSFVPSQCSIHSSAGFSAAPISVAGMPGPEVQCFDVNNRIRILDGELAGHTLPTPKSVPLPADMRPSSKEATMPQSNAVVGVVEDYFSKPIARVKEFRRRKNFNFWGEMPQEISMHIMRFLRPKDIVKCSSVSKAWHRLCFDGQLWINVNTEDYYQDIPAASLTRIMAKAGPFLKDLNLRGCAQMPERWSSDGHNISDACRNLENFSLEDCRIDRSSVHYFLLRNPRLVNINLSGLKEINNSAMRIIAQGCQQLEHLNVSWCHNVDTRGLHRIVQSCPKLRDLRASEVKGFDEKDFLMELFSRNTIERLILSHCVDLDDESLQILVQGADPEIDPLTERAIVPPRRFRHLDLSRCSSLTDKGIEALAYNIPHIVGLQLSHCIGLTDHALTGIFECSSHLTHLDMEELDTLTNTSLQNLAKSPCIPKLQHLNISYCENLGDSGMLQVIKACPDLRNLIMDNTRVSDLALTEAAAQIRARDRAHPAITKSRPKIGLHVVVYDCQNVTWTGVREILSRNAEPNRREVISLKCFYGYQDTVNEVMKRVLRGDSKAASRLERKWGEYMVASEEAGAPGAGSRRRRRRQREAAMIHADEEEGGPRGGRRRARSGGCTIM